MHFNMIELLQLNVFYESCPLRRKLWRPYKRCMNWFVEDALKHDIMLIKIGFTLATICKDIYE